MRGEVVMLLRAQLKAPPIRDAIVVTLTRISSGSLDDDGLRGALKTVRDGVADWLGVDDRDPIVEWRYEQLLCPRGFWATRVAVEVDDEDLGVLDRVLGAAPPQLR